MPESHQNSRSKVLALMIGHVLPHGQIRSHVALPPRFLNGKRGKTRSVPIGPELRRALERYLIQRARKHSLSPTDRSSAVASTPRTRMETDHGLHGGEDHQTRVSRDQRRHAGTFESQSAQDWAMRLYEASGHDLLIVRDGLGHRSVAVT